VAETVNTEFLQDLFHLPLSVQAFNEFEILEDICVTLGEKFNWVNKTPGHIFGAIIHS
jgi:hypothetical protein